MRPLTATMIVISLILLAAIFGFFYAWVCSTMWGLDTADPRVAIAAMQAMNASVRNFVFFPAFFLTPFAAFAAAGLLRMRGQGHSAAIFAMSGAVYFIGGLVLTMTINVPMNEALAIVPVPDDVTDAQAIWEAYSGRWQFWNITRTIASGLAFLLALHGLVLAVREEARAAAW